MKNLRMRISLYSVATVLSFTAMTANADWNGPYFGVSIGAGASDHIKQTQNNNAYNQITSTSPFGSSNTIATTTSSGRLKGNATGALADLLIGYNCQHYSNFVLSAQAEGTFFSDITMKVAGLMNQYNSTTTTSTPGTTDTNTSTYSNTDENFDRLHAMVSLVARGGYLIQPAWLIYVLGGAAEGHFVIPSSEDSFAVKRNKWELGYTVGAGFEQKFNHKWSVRAEYRYLHFDVDRHGAADSFSSTSNGDTQYRSHNYFSRKTKTDFNFNMGVVSVIYNFC